MKRHCFQPFTFKSGPERIERKADWCSYLDIPFADLAGLPEDDAASHFCGQTYDHSVHSITDELNSLYTELYDLEHDSSGYDSVAERIEEIRDEIADLEGRA